MWLDHTTWIVVSIALITNKSLFQSYWILSGYFHQGEIFSLINPDLLQLMIKNKINEGRWASNISFGQRAILLSWGKISCKHLGPNTQSCLPSPPPPHHSRFHSSPGLQEVRSGCGDRGWGLSLTPSSHSSALKVWSRVKAAESYWQEHHPPPKAFQPTRYL